MKTLVRGGYERLIVEWIESLYGKLTISYKNAYWIDRATDLDTCKVSWRLHLP